MPDVAGHETKDGGIDAYRHLRGMGRAGKTVEQVANAHRLRVGQMEALAVFALKMRDVIECCDDEIDRYDVDPPAFKADGRHPGR